VSGTDQVAESERVDAMRIDVEHVPTRTPQQPRGFASTVVVTADHVPEPGQVDVQGVARTLRRCPAPDPVDQGLHVHWQTRVHSERRQDAALPQRAYVHHPAVGPDLDRTEQAELKHGFPRMLRTVHGTEL
jgi:hypothetical protein